MYTIVEVSTVCGPEWVVVGDSGRVSPPQTFARAMRFVMFMAALMNRA